MDENPLKAVIIEFCIVYLSPHPICRGKSGSDIFSHKVNGLEHATLALTAIVLQSLTKNPTSSYYILHKLIMWSERKIRN